MKSNIQLKHCNYAAFIHFHGCAVNNLGLSVNVGCEYLSDIKIYRNFDKMYQCIYSIKAEDYSLFQWTDAVKYITGTKIEFSSQQEAKEYLTQYLKKD